MRSIKLAVKLTVLILCLVGAGILHYNSVVHVVPEPGVLIETIDRAKVALYKVGAPKDKIDELSIAINSAAVLTKIDPELIVALIKTESNFVYDAVSPKGYQGLMQTPWATMKWAEVDILLGAKIFEEKMKFSRNNLRLALALYKGGNNKLARKYAAETFRIYQSLI